MRLNAPADDRHDPRGDGGRRAAGGSLTVHPGKTVEIVRRGAWRRVVDRVAAVGTRASSTVFLVGVAVQAHGGALEARWR